MKIILVNKGNYKTALLYEELKNDEALEVKKYIQLELVRNMESNYAFQMQESRLKYYKERGQAKNIYIITLFSAGFLLFIALIISIVHYRKKIKTLHDKK